MRLSALLILAFLPSCGMIGTATQGSVEAGGVAATTALGTPAIGFVSWPAWHWLGGEIATWASGTEAVRVKAGSEAPGSSGGQPGDAIQDALNPFGGSTMLWLIVGGAIFVYFGGVGWLRKKLQDDRNAHKNRTSALEGANKRLREEVDQLWDRLMDGRGRPPGGA